MRSKTVHCKKCSAGPFLWTERFDAKANLMRWILVSNDGAEHNCPVREIVEVSCKYCNTPELWWSKETMEDGTTKNVLMESYGLPHGCEERKKHFDDLNQAKKDEYAKEKDRINAIPDGSACSVCGNGSGIGRQYGGGIYSRRCWTCGGSGKITLAAKERMLFDVRKRIWPKFASTKKGM